MKIPFLATSIKPLENSAPRATPEPAKIIIVLNEMALEPTAELKKFTASLLTPTIKSPQAKIAKIITNIKYEFSIIYVFRNEIQIVNGRKFYHLKILSFQMKYLIEFLNYDC